MSKLSIYETNWTDLVFENKNKEYGAYQLRQENSKTSIKALFMALLIIATLGSITALISKLTSAEIVETTEEPFREIITPVDLNQEIVKPIIEETVAPPQQTATADAPDVTPFTTPVVVTTAQATPDVPTNASMTPIVTDPVGTGTDGPVNVMPSNGNTNGNGLGTSTEPISNDPVVAAVLDKLPEFPGGMSKFYTYVGKNFNRPEIDAEKTLRVYVSFVIERDGSITDIIVKNDPGYGLGKEAVRVLKSLKTKWSPGILNGKAVRTVYSLPITIKTEAE
ncbi:energy transducer TonB [Flavobacterium sp. GA093]|uniref:Energy transducer TonB n=1 Tax=Flavobacterium hydrocarbonoxydans TaxID=2683249 RepID=A0A6I4NKP9_9FLAO|nr:energy transducer TonB [Flavobacterium hydrocarbonoxydans]MWB94593.1 energy transducer TonB [Flavobacterium hydrocarbonoxydans]